MPKNNKSAGKLKNLLEYPKALKKFGKIINQSNLLEKNCSQPNIREICERMERNMTKHDLLKNKEWDFIIHYDNPLTFAYNNNFQLEISIQIKGIGIEILKHNAEISVWCNEEKLCFREDLDSILVLNKLKENNGERVLINFHLDKKPPNSKQVEPDYHLQMGGFRGKTRSTRQGICWFPKSINIPRLPFPPCDVILLSEIVLANFFTEKSRKILLTPDWYSIAQISQNIFLEEYYGNCLNDVSSSSASFMAKIYNLES